MREVEQGSGARDAEGEEEKERFVAGKGRDEVGEFNGVDSAIRELRKLDSLRSPLKGLPTLRDEYGTREAQSYKRISGETGTTRATGKAKKKEKRGGDSQDTRQDKENIYECV